MTSEEWNKILAEAEKFCTAEIMQKLDKAFVKIKTVSYDQGYKAGANFQNNKPCVCGFWGNK